MGNAESALSRHNALKTGLVVLALAAVLAASLNIREKTGTSLQTTDTVLMVSPVAFSYNEQKYLPAKNIHNTDFWGYYNGQNENDNYVCPVIMNGRLYSGSNKEPNLDYAKLGSLNSVISPTGGITTFSYGINTSTNAEHAVINKTSHTGFRPGYNPCTVETIPSEMEYESDCRC